MRGEFCFCAVLQRARFGAALRASIADEFPRGIVLEHQALCKLAVYAGHGTDLDPLIIIAACAFFGGESRCKHRQGRSCNGEESEMPEHAKILA
ncbi:MAG TPA: hypothetical protein VET25_07760 [Aestuariivirgaceae bacterium]|nr:hypothetical protein [Aestuariivirgaceae bacterium]